MERKDFDAYSSLKNIYNVYYRDFPLNRIMTPQFLKLTFWKSDFKKLSFVDIIKIIFLRRDFTKLIKAFSDNKVIVTNSNDRRDYIDTINIFFSHIADYQHVPISTLPFYKSFYYGIGNLMTAIFLLMRQRINSGLNFKAKFYLLVNMAYYLGAFKDLERTFRYVNLNGKKYVAFNSSYDFESLLTLFFNEKNVQTYHLSHGISYINYNTEIPFDCVNGENINSKSALVWGESSKRNLIDNYSFNSNNIIVTGNPKYPFKNLCLKSSFQNGILFLGRPIYDNDNVEILKIAGRLSHSLGITISVKAHPFSDLKKFYNVSAKYGLIILPKDHMISEILNSNLYDFAISHNTTVYYESMYFDMMCFRYGINFNEDYEGMDDIFTNEISLMEKIEKYKKMDNSVLSIKVQELLIRVIGMGIDRYKEVLD